MSGEEMVVTQWASRRYSAVDGEGFGLLHLTREQAEWAMRKWVQGGGAIPRHATLVYRTVIQAADGEITAIGDWVDAW